MLLDRMLVTLPVALAAAALMMVMRPAAQDPAAIQRGAAIFAGKGMCHVCHGPAGKGTPLAPNLTDSVWLNIAQPTPASIDSLIRRGVAKPKQHPTPMPPMGGASLGEAEIRDVSLFVFSLGPRAGNQPRS